jgi:hypothetical protein
LEQPFRASTRGGLRFDHPDNSTIREPSSAAGELAVAISNQRQERSWSEKHHERLEREWSAMGMVAISDSTHRMTEDFD